MVQKKKYYAVVIGKVPGIYTQWFGAKGAQAQVHGFPGAVYKGFASLADAKAYLSSAPTQKRNTPNAPSRARRDSQHQRHFCADETGKIVIYTDGGSLGNPGPGGYGIVIIKGTQCKELSKGFRLTTNNRMELLACIEGLKAVRAPSAIVLYSDSQYVINGMTKGWAKKWRANRWMRTSTEPAINPDLWEKLLNLCEKHDVTFCWVKGHAGNAGNERCDTLATAAASGSDLSVDKVYELSLKR